jgi:hypothetical protein
MDFPEGWSVYEFTPTKNALSTAEGPAPQYYLRRVKGPFETQGKAQAALWSYHAEALPAVIRPDTGKVFVIKPNEEEK